MKITVQAEVAKANAELNKINTSINKMKESQEKTNKVFDGFMKGGKFVAGATVAIKSIEKVIDVSKKLMDLHKTQVLAETHLQGALIASGNAIGYTVQELKSMAGALQETTTFGDEATMSAQGMLLAYQNVGKDAFPVALKASMDLSTALGTDLNSSVQKVGNALNIPIEGLTSLKDIGVVFTKDQEKLIKKLVEENNIFEAQKIILDEINSRYGGMADLVGGLDVSKLDKIKNLSGDIGENFGSILTSKLSPTLNWIEEKMNELATKTATIASIETGDFDSLSDEDIDRMVASQEVAIQKMENTMATMGTWNQEYIRLKMRVESANAELDGTDEKPGIRAEQEKRIKAREKRLAEYTLKIFNQEQQAIADAKKKRIMENPVGDDEERLSAMYHAEASEKSIANAKTWFDFYTEIEELVKSTNAMELVKLDVQDEILEKRLKSAELLKTDVALYKVNKDEIDLSIVALKEQLAINSENRKTLTGENDALTEAQAYLKSNLSIIENTYDVRIKNMEADIASAKEKLNIIGLNEEEKEQLEAIITIKQNMLDSEIEANSEVAKFLLENNNFIKENVDLRIVELGKIKASAEAQMKLVGATEAQKKLLQEIIDGVDEEVSGLEEVSSWADKIQDAFDIGKPPKWDDWFKDLEGAISKITGAISGLTSSFTGMISSNFDKLTNELDAKVKTMNKALDAMVKNNLKARKTIDTNEKDSMTALQAQYDADAISYENYMAQKLSLEAEAQEARDILDAEEQEKKDEITRKQDELNKRKFEADKKNQIATAIMNSASAIVRAYADLGPIFGSIATAGILTMSGFQISNIASQSYVPALAEGGVATRPMLAEIGDGDEPEMVLPLSKAKDFGFGVNSRQPQQQIVVKVMDNTIYGIDDFGKKVYDAIKSAQRVGKVPRNSL